MADIDLTANDNETIRSAERAAATAEAIRSRVRGKSMKTAIEYGCGAGIVGMQLANEFAELLLVDSSAEKIAQAERNISEAGSTAVTALCADFMDAVPDDLRADCIFSSLALHHIHDTEGAMRRFYGILRDGGHLLIADIDTDDGSFHAEHANYGGHNGFDQSSLKALAEKAGFAHAESEPYYHGIKYYDGKETPYSMFILDAVKWIQTP